MKELLKFMTCGSVDDGKSTLIGHLLYNTNSLYTDQIDVLNYESRNIYGTQMDYSLLLDGLEAEREQRITIDVAYRFFASDKRNFIIADTPGHKEYTKNMAVGASFSDASVILIDASKGLVPQTYRHFYICYLMGIRDFIFAINKMDLVDYSCEIFSNISDEINKMISECNTNSVSIIPISATKGDNISQKSENTPWYFGNDLLNTLDELDIKTKTDVCSILPVQRISVISNESRWYQGCLECGTLSVGDTVSIFPGNEKAKIKSVAVCGKECDFAEEGDQISLRLDDDYDISKGSVICKDYTPFVSTLIKVNLLWLNDSPLTAGRIFYMKSQSGKIPVTVSSIINRLDVETGEKLDTDIILKNDLAQCTLTCSVPIAVDSFTNHRCLAEFILIDRIDNSTAAYGNIIKPLDNNFISPTKSDVTPMARAIQKNQIPFTIWLTGLPASGKTSIANAIERELLAQGKHTMLLDGDNIRSGINKNLGFSKEDRSENIRITAEIAKLMNEAGLITIVSLVSPGKSDREKAKEIVGENFFEIYVATPAEICASRDKKGYYKKASEGKIKEFTGVSSNYEEPENPNLTVSGENNSVKECADKVISLLRLKNLI